MGRRSLLLFTANGKPTSEFADFLRDVQVPGDNLESIDAALQTGFFQKDSTGHPRERWDLARVELSCPPERLREHLRMNGFVEETKPHQRNYLYADWPGGLAPRAAARLKDLVSTWKSGVLWQTMVVHGGKRVLQPDKEGLQQCCSALGVYADLAACLWDSLKPTTELEMMRFLWEAARTTRGPHGILVPEDMAEVSLTFVDAPMKPGKNPGDPPVRPSTDDTIVEWLKTSPQPGSHLVSSGAPYGMSQDEAFWMLLGPHGHTVETFGHAASDLPIEVFMREVAGAVHRIHKVRSAPS